MGQFSSLHFGLFLSCSYNYVNISFQLYPYPPLTATNQTWQYWVRWNYARHILNRICQKFFEQLFMCYWDGIITTRKSLWIKGKLPLIKVPSWCMQLVPNARKWHNATLQNATLQNEAFNQHWRMWGLWRHLCVPWLTTSGDTTQLLPGSADPPILERPFVCLHYKQKSGSLPLLVTS